MRATSVLRTLLAFQHTFVTGVHFEHDAFVIDVAPSYKVPRCSCCKRKVKAGYDQRPRTWRHLDMGGMLTLVRYAIRRVNCPKCGVKVEKVPWADPGSRFTLPFENQVAFLAQRCDKTAVTKQMRISWVSVGEIAARVVKRGGLTGSARLDGMTVIGIDEICYRKHHKYVTIVTDHLRGCAVWAAEGKGAETAARFFAELGPERCAKLEVVTLDLSAAFISAVTAGAPNAKQIYDRFHIQRLAHDALDEVRRDLVREAPQSQQSCRLGREAKPSTSRGRERAMTREQWSSPEDRRI